MRVFRDSDNEIMYEFKVLNQTLQKLAYYSALKMGYDIDKPRNLTKSVTVEQVGTVFSFQRMDTQTIFVSIFL